MKLFLFRWPVFATSIILILYAFDNTYNTSDEIKQKYFLTSWFYLLLSIYI